MESQFFVFGSLFDYCDVMCHDLKELDNCEFINVDTKITNKVLWFLYKIHNSGVLNRWFQLPFKSIWYGCLFDKSRINMRGGGNHFVFFDSNPHAYNSHFLSYLQKFPKTSLSLVFVNSMKSRNMRDVSYFRKHFNRIYTTDKTDAEEYDFHYVEGIHSKLDLGKEQQIKYDIVFVGAEKDRGKVLLEIYSLLVEEGKACKFTIPGLKNAPEGIGTRRLPYKETLDEVIASRAILEVCSSAQNANTQRALEAIMYNKMLITNNKNILQSKFYDPKRVFYFNSPSELKDICLQEYCELQYGYTDEFSPVHILEDIERAFCSKKEGEYVFV